MKCGLELSFGVVGSVWLEARRKTRRYRWLADVFGTLEENKSQGPIRTLGVEPRLLAPHFWQLNREQACAIHYVRIQTQVSALVIRGQISRSGEGEGGKRLDRPR
jgi:hypothetical protein